MSPKGRPKGEYRSAKHEGDPVDPPGRPKGEYRSAKHEGNPIDAPGRPKGTYRSAQHQGSPMGGSSYWIGVISQEHATRAAEGGFAQVNHGRAAQLERLKAGDGFAIYSPRTAYPGGEPLQAFTAIGRVKSGGVYPVEVSEDFRPFRVDVAYVAASPAPIRPLIDALTFLRNKTHWGAAFRFGFLRVPAADFARIAAAMGDEAMREFPAPAVGDGVSARPQDGVGPTRL